MISRSRLTSTRVSQRGQCRGFSVSQRATFQIFVGIFAVIILREDALQ